MKNGENVEEKNGKNHKSWILGGFSSPEPHSSFHDVYNLKTLYKTCKTMGCENVMRVYIHAQKDLITMVTQNWVVAGNCSSQIFSWILSCMCRKIKTLFVVKYLTVRMRGIHINKSTEWIKLFGYF